MANKVTNFLREHNKEIVLGITGIIGAGIAYKIGNKKGMKIGIGLVTSMIYADHDLAIGKIYDTVERTYDKEELGKFIELGHRSLKSWK